MVQLRALMATTRGRVLVVGLAVLVVATAIVAQMALAPAAVRPPDASELHPPSVPIMVSVGRVRYAGDGDPIVGLPVTVTAHALAEAGVAALELWDGPTLAAVENVDPDSIEPAFYARWQWRPQVAGEHVIFVRAIDGQGRGGQSSAVRVTVMEPALSFVHNRRLGRPIAIAGSGAGLGDSVTPAAAYAIPVPAVQATVQGCQVTLSVTNAPAQATGIALYGLAPSGFNFVPLSIKPKANDEGLNVDLKGGGGFLFTASAFNGQVEAYSPPVAVVAPDGCSAGGWTGDVSLVDGKLLTTQQVDRAYLYLRQGDGAAVRVPPEQGQFVVADGASVLDFGSLLPPLDGSPLEVEAWGWTGDTLHSLGNGSYAPPPPPAADGGALSFGGGPVFAGGGPVFAPGLITKLNVINRMLVTATNAPSQCSKEFCYIDDVATEGTIERPAQGSTAPIVRRFQWSTLTPNVNQVVWQVLPYQPADTADLAPPFLIDQGVAPVAAGQSAGEFTIDFAKYLSPGVPAASVNLSPEEQLGQLSLPAWAGGAATGPTPAPTANPGSGSGGFVLTTAVENMIAFNNRFYIRIVPLQFNSATYPSNTVTLDVVEPTQVVIVDPHAGEGVNENAYTISWTYTPPIAANSKYARCAIVTGFTADYVNLLNPWHSEFQKSLANQTPICYKPPSDSGWSPFDAFDSFVEFVGDVWDYVADGYAWIKQKVIELALAALPCEQIASKSTCETIAKTALDVAIAAFTGMPPSLPNFDAAVAGLKGDLSTLIVESASVLPGVAGACGLASAGQVVSSKVKSCEELAGIAVDAAINEVIAARSEAAGQATGKNWPGVLWKPDPRGLYHPPAFDMTITRTSDPVLPTNCTVQAAMKSTKKAWAFTELHEGYPKKVTADVSGQPLLPSSFAIPPMKPGETMERTVWLPQPAKWFESWRAELYWNYAEAMLQVEGFTRAWALLTAGSELTFHVTSNCAKPSQKGPYTMTGSAWGS